MGRAPCCDKASVKKGPWSPEEDAKLKDFIEKYGTGGNWIALPQRAGLKRCGKSCRLRWLNYLRPNIKHGEFSDDEDRVICSLYATIGSRWSIIAAQLPGRTDNDIKNYWNTKLKKKLMAMLPSLQKKSSLFPSLPLQSPHPSPYDHLMPTSSSSSSFYNYTPSFMNFNNSTTTTIVQDHVDVTHNFSSPSPTSTHLTSLIDVKNNCYYPEFQDDYQSMYNTPMQEMLMFGGVSTTCSSTEGGSCMTQIKQEDQIALQGYGDFMMDHNNYTDEKPKGYLRNYELSPLHNDLEEVKQLIDNNININMFNDGDENKTTHYQKGMCYYY